MKTLLSLTLTLLAIIAHAANPAFTDFNANQFGTTGNKVFMKATGNGAVVTNLQVADGTLWVLSPAEFRVSGTGTEGEGRFLVSDLNGVLGYRTNWMLTSITNGLLSGDLSLNGRTNRLSIVNDQLYLDGVAVSGGSAAAPVNNFYSTNNFFVSGKGNTLIITQQLTLQYIKTNLLAVDASGVVTNPVYGSGITWTPSTMTLSASSSGDTTATNIVTLTQTGTNVSSMDYSLVARGGTFKLVLTNTAYIGAPSGIANTAFSQAYLVVQQPSTGTCFLTFTNGFYQFPEGVAPIIDTNNGAVTIYKFISDPITNGLLHGWMSVKSKLIP